MAVVSRVTPGLTAVDGDVWSYPGVRSDGTELTVASPIAPGVAAPVFHYPG